MEGMARRLAAASTARVMPAPYDPSGHAAATAGAPALRNAPLIASGVGGATPTGRGEIVTIALVAAGAPVFKGAVGSVNERCRGVADWSLVLCALI